MTTNAMQHTCGSDLKALATGLGLALLATATPATAQDDVTDRTPGVDDIALTPLSDLNLRRDPIPPILIRARENPFANEGMEDCENIRVGIGDLDAVLGEDVDAQTEEEKRLSVGSVAQSAIGMFIPFRGIIREISGANAHEFEFRQAIAAGLMRRAYLKGLGEARGCPYPARPMPDAMRAALQNGQPLVAAQSEEQVVTAQDGTRFVSRPVVQPID